MYAAGEGHEPCLQTLLRAKANTELLDEDGDTALQHAEGEGHTAIAQLLGQHASPPEQAAQAARRRGWRGQRRRRRRRGRMRQWRHCWPRRPQSRPMRRPARRSPRRRIVWRRMEEGPECCRRAEWSLGPPSGAGDRPRTTAVDRRSTPSARADRQEPLPMFRCPGCRVFPDHLITFLSSLSSLASQMHIYGTICNLCIG